MLAVAGKEEGNHHAEVEALVSRLGLQSRVRFLGPLSSQDKRNAYAAASVFVLPSYSEGAPAAIVEALGAGVPVIATRACPWEELVSEQCGWWADTSVEGLSHSLACALAGREEDLRATGLRGQCLVERKYTWHRVAQRVAAVYGWLLGKGQKPDFVRD